jgi:hypothetical protein
VTIVGQFRTKLMRNFLGVKAQLNVPRTTKLKSNAACKFLLLASRGGFLHRRFLGVRGLRVLFGIPESSVFTAASAVTIIGSASFAPFSQETRPTVPELTSPPIGTFQAFLELE